MDKIDELCINGGFYQYDGKLKKQFKIKEILENFVGTLDKNKVYVLWPWSKEAQYLNDLAEDKWILNIQESGNAGIKNMLVNTKLKRKYRCLIAPTYSSKWKRKFRKIVLSCINRCQVIDIYDLLARRGVIGIDCQFGLLYEDIVANLNIYEKKKGTIDESKEIKRLIADYFAIRDFKNAFRYIDKLEYLKDADTYKYINLRKEIEIYLEELKEKIKKQDHIVVNWLDALRYDEMSNMGFVCEQANSGMFFTNMYANTPTTDVAMKTLFTGDLLLDDKLYMLTKGEDFENTKLYRLLQNMEYEFLYFGFQVKGGIFNNSSMERLHFYNCKECPSALLQYELICSLARAKKKCFAIVLNIGETHPLYMNPIDKCAQPIKDHIYMLQNGEKKEIKQQIVKSQKYLDEQLRFYYQFYESVPYKIYMSDHGQVRAEGMQCFKGMHHVIFCISGKDIIKKKNTQITSLEIFPDVIDKLIKKKYDEICKLYKKQYVLIQQEDIKINSYNHLSYYLKNEKVYKRLYAQHRGIITEKECYVRNVMGEEYYVLDENDENLIECEEYAERIKFLREIAGNRFLDIRREEKNRVSNELYKQLGFEIDKDVELIE